MRTKILLIIGLLLLLIIGCSNEHPSTSPLMSDLPSGDEPSEATDDSDVVRSLMATYYIHGNDPQETYEAYFDPEGLGSGYSTLVDCVAATYYYYNGSYYNYVLVCDTQYKWSGSYASYPRCQLWKLTTADEPTATRIGYIPGTYTKDPDGCDLIEENNYLYAFVYDDFTEKVYLYYWALNAAGGVTAQAATYSDQFYDADMNGGQGVAVTITDSWPNYDLFVCDPENDIVFVFNETTKTSATEYAISGASPIDVCAVRKDSNEWFAYVACRNDDDGNDDVVKVFDWNYSTSVYDTTDADCSTGTDTFPFILSIASLKWESHDNNTVAVLSYDTTDMKGYRLRQLDFGNGYTCTEDFDAEIVGGIASESLAICKQRYYVSPDWYIGYHYVLSDRDPDLNSCGTTNGRNVIIYNNNTT